MLSREESWSVKSSVVWTVRNHRSFYLGVEEEGMQRTKDHGKVMDCLAGVS